MAIDRLIQVCARIRLIQGGKTVSNGSGVILNIEGKFYLMTAYHCIYGEDNQYKNILLRDIIVETQTAFNTPLVECSVNAIKHACKVNDWAVLEIEINLENFPVIKNVAKFNVESKVHFRGFQKVIGAEGRTFDGRVKESSSNSEFKITLANGDKFNDDTDNAKGLSGSGVFIIQHGKLHIIGILKSVNGNRATNDDIKCCSINVIEELFPQIFTEISNFDLDYVAADQFEGIEISDNRNIIDKIRDVCPDIPDYKIKKYCADIALGKTELLPYDERTVSAMKFRIFDACQVDLMDYFSTRTEQMLSANEIKDLLKIYNDKAMEIIQSKSMTYNYPIKDPDILSKIVLDLINECYLSFDKQGIYEY